MTVTLKFKIFRLCSLECKQRHYEPVFNFLCFCMFVCSHVKSTTQWSEIGNHVIYTLQSFEFIRGFVLDHFVNYFAWCYTYVVMIRPVVTTSYLFSHTLSSWEVCYLNAPGHKWTLYSPKLALNAKKAFSEAKFGDNLRSWSLLVNETSIRSIVKKILFFIFSCLIIVWE